MVFTALAESLLQKFTRGKPRKMTELAQRMVRPEVLPYMHHVSHNLKKAAKRHGVPILFSAPCKLAQLYPYILSDSSKKHGCTKKHARPYLEYATGVIHDILLSCGKIYVGQIGHCVNECAREHELSLKGKDICLRTAIRTSESHN